MGRGVRGPCVRRSLARHSGLCGTSAPTSLEALRQRPCLPSVQNTAHARVRRHVASAASAGHACLRLNVVLIYSNAKRNRRTTRIHVLPPEAPPAHISARGAFGASVSVRACRCASASAHVGVRPRMSACISVRQRRLRRACRRASASAHVGVRQRPPEAPPARMSACVGVVTAYIRQRRLRRVCRRVSAGGASGAHFLVLKLCAPRAHSIVQRCRPLSWCASARRTSRTLVVCGCCEL
jgi:hypothetical protein